MGYLCGMSNLLKQLEDFLGQHGLLGVPSYVGFSGGADSTALLWLLAQLGQPLTAVHFDHGLRGAAAAAADAAFCRDFCDERRIPLRLVELRVAERRRSGEGIEAAGRRLRLAAWQELAAEEARPILLAHHADDALEELFLRLGRGGSVSALTGLRERRRIGGMVFYRPFLTVRKSALEALLAGGGITPCLDASNLENLYRRNAVRNRLLPLFREIFGTEAGAVRSLAVLRQESAWLEEQARLVESGLSDRQSWRRVPAALLARVLRRRLRREFGVDVIPGRPLLARVAEALAAPAGSRIFLPAGQGRWLCVDDDGVGRLQAAPPLPKRCWAWRREPRLELPEAGGALVVLASGAPLPCGPHERFAAEALPEVLTVRGRQDGDRMVPFGSTGPRKVQDLLVNARVPRERRDGLPLVLVGGEIIWIPGVRRAEFGRCADARGGEVTLAFVADPAE